MKSHEICCQLIEAWHSFQASLIISSPSSLALQMTAGSLLFHQTPGKPESDHVKPLAFDGPADWETWETQPRRLDTIVPVRTWQRGRSGTAFGKCEPLQAGNKSSSPQESTEDHLVNHLNQGVVLLNQQLRFNLIMCLWILDKSLRIHTIPASSIVSFWVKQVEMNMKNDGKTPCSDPPRHVIPGWPWSVYPSPLRSPHENLSRASDGGSQRWVELPVPKAIGSKPEKRRQHFGAPIPTFAPLVSGIMMIHFMNIF